MIAINEKDSEEFRQLFGDGIFGILENPLQEMERFDKNREEIHLVKSEFPELDWYSTLGVIRTMTMTDKGPREAMDLVEKEGMDISKMIFRYRKQLGKVKYLLNKIKDKEIETEEIIVSEVSFSVWNNIDCKMQKIDNKYSVIVSPVMPSLYYRQSAFTSELPLLRRLGIISSGIDSLYLEKWCEFGDELALTISKFVSKILPWRWKLIKIIIPNIIKDNIKNQFPDAEEITFEEPIVYAQALGGHKLFWHDEKGDE